MLLPERMLVVSLQKNQVKLPVWNSGYLAGKELINENKLFELLCNLSEKEKIEVLSLSVDGILEQAIGIEQLTKDKVASSETYSPYMHYRTQEAFWISLAELVEKRKSYLGRYF